MIAHALLAAIVGLCTGLLWTEQWQLAGPVSSLVFFVLAFGRMELLSARGEI